MAAGAALALSARIGAVCMAASARSSFISSCASSPASKPGTSILIRITSGRLLRASLIARFRSAPHSSSKSLRSASSCSTTATLSPWCSTYSSGERLGPVFGLARGITHARLNNYHPGPELLMRIDVHHHLFPPAYIAKLVEADHYLARGVARQWTPQASIEDMDAAGRTTASH